MTGTIPKWNDGENGVLKQLSFSAKTHLNDFEYKINAKDISSEIKDDLSEFDGMRNRKISLNYLDALMTFFLREKVEEDKAPTDAWLAPRVHACLRLTRREASNKEIWAYLAYRYVPYVRWRWADEKKKTLNLNRLLGRSLQKDNALSRLWWGAELIRNGNDYGFVIKAFGKSYQDIPNTLMSGAGFQEKNVAFSASKLASTFKPGPVNGVHKGINRKVSFFSRALTATFAVVPLESIVQPYQYDYDAIEDWIKGTPDTKKYEGEIPDGPYDSRIAPEDVENLDKLMENVAGYADLLNSK